MIEAPRSAGEKVAVSTSNAQSGVLDGRDLVFSCTVACYVVFGSNPTATDTCLMVPANTPLGFTNVKVGDLMGILGTGSGQANIVPVG